MAERAQALRLLDCMPGRDLKTAGVDKAYGTRDFVADCRARNLTPNVARHVRRWGGNLIDGCTTRHGAYEVSHVNRKCNEEYFDLGKTAGQIWQTLYCGLRWVNQHFRLTMVVSNLTRIEGRLYAGPQGVRRGRASL